MDEAHADQDRAVVRAVLANDLHASLDREPGTVAALQFDLHLVQGVVHERLGGL